MTLPPGRRWNWPAAKDDHRGELPAWSSSSGHPRSSRSGQAPFDERCLIDAVTDARRRIRLQQRNVMMYQTIDNCVEGRSGINTLNRPDDLNAIVPRMREELENAVAEATRDRAVKAIILQGRDGRSAPPSISRTGSITGTIRSRRTGCGTRSGHDHVPGTWLGAALHVAVAKPDR
jgi:hypothetical protein